MLAEEIMPGGKFTEPQLELLKMFSREFPEKVWVDIRDMVSDYFLQRATEEMDDLFKKEGWGDDKIKEWASTHMRTPYRKKH